MLLKKVLIDRTSSAVIQNPLLRSCLSTWKLLPQRSGFSRLQTRGLLTAAAPFSSLRQPTIPLFAIHTSIRRFANAAAGDAAANSKEDVKKTVEAQEQERINKEKEKEREKEGQQREKEKTALGGRIIPSK